MIFPFNDIVIALILIFFGRIFRPNMIMICPNMTCNARYSEAQAQHEQRPNGPQEFFASIARRNSEASSHEAVIIAQCLIDHWNYQSIWFNYFT